MLFTIGKDLEYERLMQVKPNFDRSVLAVEERECKYCLHYDPKHRKCRLKKCVIFEN